MSDIREKILNDIFNNLMDFLKIKDDGNYIFKNDEYQYSHIDYITEVKTNDGESSIPDDNEICRHFEEKIISIIPYAIIYINRKREEIYHNKSLRLEIVFDINPINKELDIEKISEIQKELDLFEAYRLLFFPTTKESKVKIGKGNLKSIYIPERLINNFKVIGNIIQYQIGDSKITRGAQNLSFVLLKDLVESYIESKSFKNPISIDKITLPKNPVDYEEEIIIVKQFFWDFLNYYKQLIEDNFYLISNFFYFYTNYPIRLKIYVEKKLNYFLSDSAKISCLFEKRKKSEKCEVLLVKNQKIKYPTKDSLFVFDTFASYFIYQYNNALDFAYHFLKEELYDILAKIENQTLFSSIQPQLSKNLSNLQEELKSVRSRLFEVNSRKIVRKEYGYDVKEDGEYLNCDENEIDLLFNQKCLRNKKTKSIEIDIFGQKIINKKLFYVFGECKFKKKIMNSAEIKCFLLKANIFADFYTRHHEKKGELLPEFHLLLISKGGFPDINKRKILFQKFCSIPKTRLKIEVIDGDEFLKLLKIHKIRK